MHGYQIYFRNVLNAFTVSKVYQGKTPVKFNNSEFRGRLQ